MKNKKILILLIVVLVGIIALLVGTSYAYFTSNVTGNDTANQTVITSGNMRLALIDGDNITLNNAIPGDSVKKTFSVENTGTVETKYDIYFSELCNIFVDKTDLVYTIRHTSANGYELLTETEVPSTSGKIIDSQSIAPNETQTYEITIKFLNKNENQDDNQGAYFSTKLNINDYKGALHCSKYNNTVKYYVNNVEVNEVPSNVGYLYSTSSCTNDAEVTWNNEQWNYAVDYDSSTSDSVCSINFVPEEYTITYNLDGGTNNSSNPSSYTIESDTITLSNPTKEGYEFNGWTGDNTTIAKGSTGNKTYTATWIIDKCASVTYQDGTTCSVTYSQQTGTYNRLAYSSVDSSYRCPAKDESTGGSSCNGTTNACASGHTSCTLSNCGSYGSCSATYTDQTGTKKRTCTQTCKSTYDSSITCSTNTNYQDSTSCTGTQVHWIQFNVFTYYTCPERCYNYCKTVNNGYSQWSCTADEDYPSSASLRLGSYCWCAN